MRKTRESKGEEEEKENKQVRKWGRGCKTRREKTKNYPTVSPVGAVTARPSGQPGITLGPICTPWNSGEDSTCRTALVHHTHSTTYTGDKIKKKETHWIPHARPHSWVYQAGHEICSRHATRTKIQTNTKSCDLTCKPARLAFDWRARESNEL